MKNELKIRIATPDDAAALLAIYKPYVENTTITFEYDVPTLEDFTSRIVHTLARYPYLVACLDGEPVGYAYAGAFKSRAAYDRAVELSVYVKDGVQGHGIGKALYAALEALLKLQHVTNLNACIASPVVEDEYLNHNSIQFHQHLGYSMVGEFHKCAYKFGRWYNMVWMEKIIADHPDRQPDVIPFAQIPPEIYC